MAAPLISVLINTFNNGSFIEEAIDSALAQDFPAAEREIIVVDDGSTDDTPERVKKYDGRIRYFRTKNGDQCSAVTFGVAQAKGDVIALLDGDDVWLPNKVSRVVQEFAKDARVVMVYHKYAYWDSRENSVWDPDYVTNVAGDVLADRRKLLTYSTAPTSSLAFRRDAFQPLTRIPLDRAFTYDLFLNSAALFLGPVACVPEVLTRQRIHGRNRWVSGKDGPDEATLRRRIARWEAAMEITRDWLNVYAPKSTRPQAGILLRRWQLFQDSQRFLIAPPSRIEFFLFQMRRNRLLGPVWGAKVCAINYFNAFASLVTGYRYFGALEAFWHKLDEAKDSVSSLVLGRARSTAGNPLEM